MLIELAIAYCAKVLLQDMSRNNWYRKNTESEKNDSLNDEKSGY